MATIYLLRHGQASFGAADYDQLSALGLEQARVLGEHLRTRIGRVDLAVSGTMKRHRQTAGACLSALDHALAPAEDAGFNEYDHQQIIEGLMDRKTFVATLSAATDRQRRFQDLFTQAMSRWQAGAHDHQYAETWSVFRARCIAALERVHALLEPKGTAVVFTSGGAISAIAQQLLQLPDAQFPALNWSVVNASVTKLVSGRGALRLSTFNEHAHFEGPQLRLLSYR